MPMKGTFSYLFLVLMAAGPVCTAQQPPAARNADLRAADGVRLKASYYPASKPGPGILLLHQCDHDRKIWDGLAKQLAAAGFHVVAFDLRGFGESGDQPHNQGNAGPIEPAEEMQKWPGDIDVALQYLKSQPGVKAQPVGVGGGSCGVDNAIKTAMRHPEVKSLVLLAGPADLKGRQFLRQSRLPVFFAVAEDDQYHIMVPMTAFLYTISASPGKKFERFKTGHHAAEIFSVHPELKTSIVNWFRTTLVKTPGQAPLATEVPPIPPKIHDWDLLEQPGGPASLEQRLKAARAKDPKAPFLQEYIMDEFAYEHEQAGDARQALEIMKLAAAAYPESPNVYDNLGDAYLASGDKDSARNSEQKALELLPSDKVFTPEQHAAIKASAEEKLKKLGADQ
jgi:dienelactone hydrolase